MNKLLSISTAVAFFGASAVAQAATIDFTTVSLGATPSSVLNLTNVQSTNVDVTVTALGGTITVSSDGLGVAGNGSADLNVGEALKVSFSTPVDIQSIGLADLDGNKLFYQTDSGAWIVTNQQGQLVQQGIGVFSGNGSAVAANDTLTIDLSSIVASVASVMVVPLSGAFNLASVSFNPTSGTVGVPELSASGTSCAALLLAGVGMLLTGRRRVAVNPTSV